MPALKRLLAMLAAALMPTMPAVAQDNSADRAEMDLVAGRILFQNSPLSDRIVAVRLPAATAAPVADPTPRRRPVRVILPSPYATR